ncbi:hypothetical protein GDO81_029831 [Engystomops pustulosus]|uniref:UPAR/Ly6 domain-containing protein n=1 Tax=Engystomops pustulosus TaxID=76066 RepID=A0AAV6ZNU6_ENGPU|nr:hypothetical protein GDO81_029831 [Engystomops pustulosus]
MMRSFIISLTILCAISGADSDITCFQCLEKNSNDCEGKSVECPDSTECYVKSEYYHAMDASYNTVEKGCNTGSPCDVSPYISNFFNKEIRMNVQCCRENNCNIGGFYIPPEPTEHYGRTCTSCYEDGLEECVSDRKVQCLLEEDKCMKFIGTLRDPGGNVINRTFWGCASPLACEYKFGALIGLEEIDTKCLECTEE